MRALLDLVRSVATVILPDTESWQEIWAVVRRNKLRALLTACGVFWGMFMLVVLLGIGNGLERGTAESVGGLAVQAIWIWPQRTTMPHAGLGPGRPIRFKNADVAALQAVPGVEVVAPRHRLGGWRVGVTVTAGAKTSTFNVVGDVPGLLEVEPLMVAAGRFINRNDLDQRRKVAVIGEQVRDILFGEGVDPRGQYVQVRGIFFQVVGAVKSLQSGDEAEKVAASVFVPLPTFQQAFNQPDSIGWFALKAASDAPAGGTLVEAQAKRALAQRHRVHPDDTQAFGSYNAMEKARQLRDLFAGIEVFIWFVGALTLLAGMLGVSNILLIGVKERTREIGIRKALGATPSAIVRLIVQESLALTSLSGYAGLVAGVALLEALRHVALDLPNAPIKNPEIELGAAFLAVAALVLAGLFAAIIPARHAARVHPVEALRAE